MTDKQLDEFLKAIRAIPEGNDEAARAVLKAAAESITLETLKSITVKKPKGKQGNCKNSAQEKGFIKFTRMEIENMPESIQKLFLINDKVVSYRVHNGLYQARYRRDGYKIEVAAKDFETMKRKFIQKLLDYRTDRNGNKRLIPKFDDYLDEWLKIKKNTVKESTYKGYVSLLDVNVRERFGEKKIDEITRKDMQEYLLELHNSGKERTALKTKQLLSSIFDVIAEDFEIKSPISRVELPHHETKKGTALTKAEESRLVEFCLSNPLNNAASSLLVLLYTGMRVGELKSMRVEGEFIICETEKVRKGYAAVYRKIPITPMMKKVLPHIDFAQAARGNKFYINTMLKQLLPGHHTHELRYTFITRCKECGCAGEVVMLWAGHTFDADVKTSKVDRGYTTYSDEFLLKEAKKVNYDI